HTRQQAPRLVVECLDFCLDTVDRGQAIFSLAQEHDALDLFFLVVPNRVAVLILDLVTLGIAARLAKAHAPQPGLMPTFETNLAGRPWAFQWPPFDDILDADRQIID